MQSSKLEGYWESEDPYLYFSCVDIPWYGEIEKDGQTQVIELGLTYGGDIDIYLFDPRNKDNFDRSSNYYLSVEWRVKGDKLIISDIDSDQEWTLYKAEEKFIPTASPKPS